jgi:NADPH2:quinone reductase
VKAVLCHEPGDLASLRLSDAPSIRPSEGAVRIGVRACGVNFADLLGVRGQYQVKPPPPFAPGLEVAGEILELGPGVEHLAVGQRVAALSLYGGFAEEVTVPAAGVVGLPDAMDFETAAGFLVAYGTSHVALDHRAHLQPGEVLLVHGAAGGVGLTAVELGKRMGATVIATASTPEKLALAREYGADHTINYRDEDFRQRVKALTGGAGANVIYDPVGGDVFTTSLRCIAWEGRLLVIGFASGTIPQVPANYTLVKNCAVVGVYWGAYLQREPAVLRRSFEQLLAWYAEGLLKPHISERLPLERAAEALQRLADREAKGKLVLVV